MKRYKAIMLAMAMGAGCAQAQVTNMALELQPGGYAECGKLAAIDNLKSYTLQLWFCGAATSDTQPGILLRRGDDASQMLLAAINSDTVTFSIGSSSISASGVTPDQWHQLTLICDNGDGRLLIDGAEAAQAHLAEMPAAPDAVMYLGSGSFQGRIDDVRIWDTVLIPDYDYYINTTLNEFNPQVENLVVYYKLDQADCPDVVNYKSIWAHEEYSPNHALLSAEGACKVAVNDNPRLPYLINSAYTANERFWDRNVSRGQYLVSNDIIILGIQSYSDGHLKYVTPNCHADLTDCTYLPEFEGRTGVMQFPGDGAKMVANSDAFQPDAASGYTFETFMYIDQWVPGATIMRQETDDHSAGFAVELGSEDSQALVVRVNGKEFTRKLGNTQKQGSWVHLAIVPNPSATQSKNSLTFFVNGNGLPATSDPGEIINLPSGAEDCEVVIGENFVGKLDETALWSRTYSSDEFKAHIAHGLPMPGIGTVITADPMWRALAYYKYDDPQHPGWDYYSQDHWLRIIDSAYQGYTGYNIRISVKSHKGWQGTIESAARRKIFAQDLARLSEPYAGVELDLEWAESAYQIKQLAELCKTIREYLPEGKLFFLSCHCYGTTYQVPKEYMEYLDGFTFQVYGPQSNWFNYNTFVNCANTFVKWGFPKDKITLAYSTTTSGGYKDGRLSTYVIRGVKDGFMGDDYVPSDIENYKEIDGMTYWFTGTAQTYRRAKYCVDHGLQGIFYWDMGNDMPFDSGKNLARISSYALCGNVDPYVTSVQRQESGIVSPTVADKGAAVFSHRDGAIEAAFLSGEAVKSLSVYTLDGRAAQHRSLAPGLYLVQAVGQQGSVACAKVLVGRNGK